MIKEDQALKTIGEVSENLGLPQHVIRFWEKKFSHIKPIKKEKGRRYYSINQINILKEIKFLLYEKQYSIKGAQKLILEEQKRKRTNNQNFDKLEYDDLISDIKEIRNEIEKIMINGA